MANMHKVAAGTEAAMDALNVIVNKALGFPKVGTHAGGGIHCTMPSTWNGTGQTPTGWTKQRCAVWVAAANDARILISDALATELQQAGALANLNAGEISTLTTALAARSNVDVDLGSYIPK